VLAVPALVYLVGEDVHAATTSSLVIVAVAAIAGAAGQVERNQVCWAQVVVFAPAAVVASVAGTLANEAASDELLLFSLAGVMLAAATFMWWKAAHEGVGPAAACPPLRPARTAGAGFAIGGLTGLLGVGGGFLVVPMLSLALRFPLRRAIGTSLVIVAMVSLFGLTAHLARGAGDVDVGVTAAMAGACALGAVAGTRIGQRLPHLVLGRAFALVVALTAGLVIVQEI
jgi:hypothetical protein